MSTKLEHFSTNLMCKSLLAMLRSQKLRLMKRPKNFLEVVSSNPKCLAADVDWAISRRLVSKVVCILSILLNKLSPWPVKCSESSLSRSRHQKDSQLMLSTWLRRSRSLKRCIWVWLLTERRVARLLFSVQTEAWLSKTLQNQIQKEFSNFKSNQVSL